jgi:hypothetical protein
MDYKLCHKILKNGPEIYECKREITDGKIQEGQDAVLWSKFLVPAGIE